MLPNITKIEYLFRPVPFISLVLPVFRALALVQWKLCRSAPPPLSVKAALITRKAKPRNIDVFVETGTFFGDMIAEMVPLFSKLISIELDERLAERARRRFARVPSVQIMQGDSGKVLAEVLKVLDKPVVFWLDGHFSGGVTARADIDTPIVEELTGIFAASSFDHVILVDDARLFGVAQDYPSVDYLRKLIAEHRPNWTLVVEDDVICIEPPAVS